MKTLSFFIGFMMVLAGVNPIEPAPIWISIPPIFAGLVMMWWGVLPKSSKNRYRK